MNPYEIVRRPRISEKTVHLQNKLNAYTFEVHPAANKIQIKDAIKALWKVDVKAVNTMNCRGKDRRMRNNRVPGVTAAWKKAIVRIADGQKIEGV
jgi:large subunit ribosomal protein L23